MVIRIGVSPDDIRRRRPTPFKTGDRASALAPWLPSEVALLLPCPPTQSTGEEREVALLRAEPGGEAESFWFESMTTTDDAGPAQPGGDVHLWRSSGPGRVLDLWKKDRLGSFPWDDFGRCVVVPVEVR